MTRMGHLFIFQFTQAFLLFIDMSSLWQKSPIYRYLIYIYYLTIPILNTIDTITRVFTIFAFMRMCIMIVHKRIIEFITVLNTNFIEWQRYEDKIRAFKLKKIAAWGTYSLTIINFVGILSSMIILVLIELYLLHALYYLLHLLLLSSYRSYLFSRAFYTQYS